MVSLYALEFLCLCCVTLLLCKNYGTLHFRCLFLTEKYKKRLYPEFTKALHQPLTLTIQDDTLSSLLILVSSEVSFFLTLFAILSSPQYKTLFFNFSGLLQLLQNIMRTAIQC